MLVENGKLIERNMRKVLITKEDLISQMRLQGCEDISRVKTSYVERDGRVSVIERDSGDKKTHGAPERQVG